MLGMTVSGSNPRWWSVFKRLFKIVEFLFVLETTQDLNFSNLQIIN